MVDFTQNMSRFFYIKEWLVLSIYHYFFDIITKL